MAEYTCEACGRVVEQGQSEEWSDDHANAEAELWFGRAPSGEERAVVCNDCWELLLPWFIEQGLATPPKTH